MTPITPYRINSNCDSAENADENDARNKRDSKRKLLRGQPVMLQAERKNTEKLLSEAMQLASYKSRPQPKFDTILKAAERDSLDSFRVFTESDFSSKNNSKKIVKNDSILNSKSSTFLESKSDSKPNSELRYSKEYFLTEPVYENKDDEPFTSSYFSKRLILIESSLSELNRSSNPSVVLKNLENIASCLSDQEKITQILTKEKNEAVIIDFNQEEMSCSLDFIKGYYEASSYSAQIKKEISNELNNIKELMSEINNFLVPFDLPQVIPESETLQANKKSNQRSLDLKPVSNLEKMNTQVIDEEKIRNDTLPLTTLRSI